jgi:hypothetical protein
MLRKLLNIIGRNILSRIIKNWDVDGTGIELCSLLGCGISGFQLYLPNGIQS